MSKLLYCVQIRNTEGRIGDESYIKYSDIDLFTVYVQFGVVWPGQDSARRSGFGSEVRILLGGQEPASTVGLEQDSSGVSGTTAWSAAGDSV